MKHLSVAAATKAATLAAKISGGGRSNCDLGGVALADFLVDLQTLDKKAVRDVVGDEHKFHWLARRECDLSWLKSIAVGVNFDGCDGFLGFGNRCHKRAQAKYQHRE
jgi:hypothetical protein